MIPKRKFKNPELRNQKIGEKSRENAKINPNYGMKGKKHSDKTKQKIRNKNLGKKLSEETKKKISKFLKGRIVNKDTKKKMSLSAKKRFQNKINHPKYGKHHSKGTKQKLSVAKIGNKNPAKRIEVRKKLSAYYLGINIKNWNGFSSYHSITTKLLTSKQKNKIKRGYNYTCQLCGFSGDGEKEIDIHHIDYNKQNNVSNNITLLCRKCHHKVNRNREYWEKYLNDKNTLCFTKT